MQFLGFSFRQVLQTQQCYGKKSKVPFDCLLSQLHFWQKLLKLVHIRQSCSKIKEVAFLGLSMQQQQSFNSLFPRTTRVGRYQKDKTSCHPTNSIKALKEI